MKEEEKQTHLEQIQEDLRATEIKIASSEATLREALEHKKTLEYFMEIIIDIKTI